MKKVFESQNTRYIKIDKAIKKIRINRSEDKSHVKKPKEYNYKKRQCDVRTSLMQWLHYIMS